MFTYPSVSKYIFLLTGLLSYSTIHTYYDVSLPYHARFFPGEPRLCSGHLTDINLRVAGTTDAQHRVEKDSRLYDTSTHGFILSGTHNPTDFLFIGFTLPFYHVHHDYSSYHNCYSIKELGMSALTAGIALNFFTPKKLDFIDVSVETGIICPPSAHRRNSFGIPAKATISLGIFDWITGGIEADIAAFLGSKGGLQYNACWFLEADHIVRGLSLLLGYSYSHQEPAPYLWHPLCCDYWSMHTMHFKFSYDLATENLPGLPCLEIFYDRLLNGINVTGNSIVGLSIRTTF